MNSQFAHGSILFLEQKLLILSLIEKKKLNIKDVFVQLSTTLNVQVRSLWGAEGATTALIKPGN